MALTRIILIFLIAIVFSTIPSAVQSHKCKSDNFAHCIHLHQLKSRLQYTYNATNASLSIAFTAKPSNPGGWIAWSINPTFEGMVGAQAFIAYEINNTVRTTTLNIASSKNFIPENLTFPFWNVSAEKRKGKITIYASLAVPENKTEVNHVWQTGPGTEPDGKIKMHEMSEENLQAKAKLSLTGALTPQSAPSGNVKTLSGNVLKVITGGGIDLGLVLGFVVSFVTLCFI